MSCFEKLRAVMLGHAVADALGVPAEFASRRELDEAPIFDMEGYGTYPYPAGCWSDDTSMSLATLDSMKYGVVDFEDIMAKFADWYYHDEYTPTGEMFDVGNTCSFAISNFKELKMPARLCGLSDEGSNGNGSLMRIHPFVVYAWAKEIPTAEWIRLIEDASALTHAHKRSKVGCGIYGFVLMRLLNEPSKEAIKAGLCEAKEYYRDNIEIRHYNRLFEGGFEETPRQEIKSGGYVVDTLEAAIWCLLNTDSYKECALAAVNLGDDTDTVAAIAGGLAGALYGYEAIPDGWLDVLKKREYIEAICRVAAGVWSV